MFFHSAIRTCLILMLQRDPCLLISIWLNSLVNLIIKLNFHGLMLLTRGTGNRTRVISETKNTKLANVWTRANWQSNLCENKEFEQLSMPWSRSSLFLAIVNIDFGTLKIQIRVTYPQLIAGQFFREVDFKSNYYLLNPSVNRALSKVFACLFLNNCANFQLLIERNGKLMKWGIRWSNWIKNQTGNQATKIEFCKHVIFLNILPNNFNFLPEKNPLTKH